MVRIIGGRAKGCRLGSVPAHSLARPTSDRIKEALFNILPPVEGANVADLFAGTGNVGLEALSRGARRVCFVESSSAMAGVLRKNILKCGLDEAGSSHEIVTLSVERAVRIMEEQDERFDLVFADPPYEREWVVRTVRILEGGRLMAPEGLVVIQHSLREALPENTGMLALADQRRYGDTLMSFLKISD